MPDNCFPTGSCSKKTIVGEFEIEDRVYNKFESPVLRALFFRAAKMIAGNFITVVPDVKDKKPLFRDEYDTEYQSDATGGRGPHDCGPFTPAGKRRTLTDKFIVTRLLYNEVAICYRKLVGTFMQDMLNKGANFSDQNTVLNNRLFEVITRDNNIQTDRLIWHGDFKSGNKKLAHFDGLIKKTFNAIGTSQSEIIKFTFTGIVSGDFIEGRAGGFDLKVPFNTNQATTIADLTTILAGLTDPETGAFLYSVSDNGSDELDITHLTSGAEIDVFVVITDGSGLNDCDEPIVHGQGTVVKSITQPAIDADVPLTIPFVPITFSNVIDQMESFYLKIKSTEPHLLANPNFRVHVSEEVWAAKNIALTKETAAFIGSGSVLENNHPFGLPLVLQPHLVGSIMFGTDRENIFFGTDLLSDLGEIRQWVNIDCEEVRLRAQTAQGVQVDQFREVVCNLDGFPVTFRPPQPE